MSAELLNPALLEERRAATGIQPTVAVETAWCFEFHAHLAAAISALQDGNSDLILMGGHASSLRLVGVNRSRDTDYLTSLDEDTAVAVMDDALERVRSATTVSLNGIPEGAFEAKRLRGGADAVPLPLVSYSISVPAVLDLGRDTAQIKVELHLLSANDMPPSESLTDTPFPLAIARTLRVPELPWQIAYKMTTLATPPVGIGRDRAAQLSRQLYDVDNLALIARGADSTSLHEAVEKVYAKELQYVNEVAIPGEPWAGIDSRLQEFAADIVAGGAAWTYAQQFQDAQMAREARLTQAGWAARVNRIRLFLRYAREHQLPSFGTLCDIEALLPIVRGSHRTMFTAVRTRVGRGAVPNATNRERFWEFLLEQSDPLEAATALAELVAPS